MTLVFLYIFHITRILILLGLLLLLHTYSNSKFLGYKILFQQIAIVFYRP